MKPPVILLTCLLAGFLARAQDDSSDVEAVRRMISLSEVVVRNDLDVSRFLQRIKNDTTFYKAFRNLRVLGFTALNDIRMLNKKGSVQAALQSRTRQRVAGGCRTMEVLEEKVSGDLVKNGSYNYMTAQMYAGLFFTQGRICGENNIVKGIELSLQDKRGLARHKEQLKMLFFNPGRKIPGIPFIGDKLDIFDPGQARYYDFSIDMEDLNGQYCYVFRIKRRENLSAAQRDQVVFDFITTWFNARTMEIVARNYHLSYNAGVYDFDVLMEVFMTRFGDLLVPQVIRYNGNWDVALKKRERGVFTATLFDFNR